MSEEQINVKEDSKVTIKRGKHNKENPYTMISKKMLRDPFLSLRDKGALCYLLSLPDDWVTHPRQVAETLGISKNQIYSILKQLIINGYATKEDVKVKGRFDSVVYTFYEERLEIPQRFKENNTVSQKPDTEKPCRQNPYTEKGTLLNTDSLTEDIYDISNPPIPPLPKSAIAESAEASGVVNLNSPKSKKIKPKTEFSPEVKEVADHMINILKQSNNLYIPPKNINPFLKEVDLMINLDKRDPEMIYAILSWAVCDYFYGPGMLSGNAAQKLRDKFVTFDKKMNSTMPQPKKERKFAPSSNDARALEIMNEMESRAIV